MKKKLVFIIVLLIIIALFFIIKGCVSAPEVLTLSVTYQNTERNVVAIAGNIITVNANDNSYTFNIKEASRSKVIFETSEAMSKYSNNQIQNPASTQIAFNISRNKKLNISPVNGDGNVVFNITCY